LEPHRIAVIPNTVSDVIVEDPLVSPGDSPLQATTPKTPGERSQETSQTTPQKSTQKTYHNKLAALKRNPVYGLEDEAMVNYNHIDHPDAASLLRGPQAILSDRQHDGNGDKATEILSANTNNRLRASQDQTAAATTNDLTPIIVKATFGDGDTQAANYGYLQAANYWYLQAANCWYLQASKNGNASAQDIVGDLYRLGQHGIPLDHFKAKEWYLKATDQGLPSAQNKIGDLYRLGHGAAAQEDAVGQYNIAQLYDYSLGVPQDFDCTKALEWYHKAADQDLAHTQFMIGNMYENGRGVPKDESVALEWYYKAAKHGDTDGWGLCTKGHLHRQALGVPMDLSIAVGCYLKAAHQAHLYAQFMVGTMYYNGEDYSIAFEWSFKAAHQGEPGAQSAVGIMYCYGQGVVQDYSRVREWLHKAASQGDARAQRELETMNRQVTRTTT
ncbi:hypothetical protein BGX33_007875, partial [Mortierella sp. NVP41]